MFTGIVEEVGSIRARQARGPGARLTIGCNFRPLAMGESISVAGVCLTVDAILEGGFEADASAETLERSSLAAARPGTRVNLERALLPTSRLGGHLVGGHVDATARLLARRPLGEATQLRFALPDALARYVAPKGSIAIDGVSLTVNDVSSGGDAGFDVVIIPHTLRATTLVDLQPGDLVNLEADVLARYVVRQLDLSRDRSNGAPADASDTSLLAALGRAGYL
jgi:riboflavin synthase